MHRSLMAAAIAGLASLATGNVLAAPSAGQTYFERNCASCHTVDPKLGSRAGPGLYDVVVQELARAQVTASTSTTHDADTTVVATGGTLTIGSVAVIIDVPMTLKGLAFPEAKQPGLRMLEGDAAAQAQAAAKIIREELKLI